MNIFYNEKGNVKDKLYIWFLRGERIGVGVFGRCRGLRESDCWGLGDKLVTWLKLEVDNIKCW